MSARLPLADIQFIAEFAAFCRGKGDEVYSFVEPRSCAVAQFGYPDLRSDGRDWDGAQIIPTHLMKVVQGNSSSGDWTFSALADRLETLIADAPMVRS